MIRKLFIVLCIILVVSSGTFAYAGEIMPRYNEISAIQSSMGIDGNTLSYSVKVLTPSTDTLDSVSIDAKLKTLGGAVVKTYSNRNLSRMGTMFIFSSNKTVTARGTYFLDYTVTCYKDGVVVDEVSKTTVTATY